MHICVGQLANHPPSVLAEGILRTTQELRRAAGPLLHRASQSREVRRDVWIRRDPRPRSFSPPWDRPSSFDRTLESALRRKCCRSQRAPRPRTLVRVQRSIGLSFARLSKLSGKTLGGLRVPCLRRRVWLWTIPPLVTGMPGFLAFRVLCVSGRLDLALTRKRVRWRTHRGAGWPSP